MASVRPLRLVKRPAGGRRPRLVSPAINRRTGPGASQPAHRAGGVAGGETGHHQLAEHLVGLGRQKPAGRRDLRGVAGAPLLEVLYHGGGPR
jgi:hypothetical protein